MSSGRCQNLSRLPGSCTAGRQALITRYRGRWGRVSVPAWLGDMHVREHTQALSKFS